MKEKMFRLLALAPYPVKRLVYNIWLRTTRAGRVANRGERLVVGSWKEIIATREFYHLMHAHRYWWAAHEIPKGSTVLDLGCGTGYGSWYLSELGNFVVGMDPDTDTIKWAKEHFGTDKLSFTTSSEIPDPEEFDVVVCFEVIEHNPEPVLDVIGTKLKQDGTLIISTANATPEAVREWLIDNNLVTVNPTHKQEYTDKTFLELLSRFFNEIEMYAQHPVGVDSFLGYDKMRRRNDVTLCDFEMSVSNFMFSEVIVAKCRR